MARVLVLSCRHHDGSALRDLLEDEGHSVQLVRDARRVHQSVAAFRPDVVVADVEVPSWDGKALLDLVAEGPKVPSVILICCRPWHGIPSASTVWLRKPIDFDQLRLVVCRSGQGVERQRNPEAA